MRRRVCAEHGCPEGIDALPNQYYCEKHAPLHSDELESEHEYEITTWLHERLKDASAEVSRPMVAGLEWQRETAERIALYVPAVLAAIQDGQIWTAVHHAAFVGLMTAHGRNAPDVRKLHELEPHAVRGLKVLEAARTGGHASKKAPVGKEDTFEKEICDAVAALHQKNPSWTWTRVCRLVARQFTTDDFAITAKTVGRRARAVDWREHPS